MVYNYDNNTIVTIGVVSSDHMPHVRLNLELDFHSGLPIYLQIVNQIAGQVSTGVLKPGDQLPTVRALAQELRVNFNTVARAYRLLHEARLLSTQQGRGTFVREVPSSEMADQIQRHGLEELTHHFVENALRLGASPEDIRRAVEGYLGTLSAGR